MSVLANLPRVEFELFDFLKICGFLLKYQIRQEEIAAKYVREMERVREKKRWREKNAARELVADLFGKYTP